MFDRLVAVGGDQTLQLCPHGTVLLLLLRTLLPTAQKVKFFPLSNMRLDWYLATSIGTFSRLD